MQVKADDEGPLSGYCEKLTNDFFGRDAIDRLGRDTRDVLNLIYECEQRGASVTVLVSTRGEMGQIVLTVLGMVVRPFHIRDNPKQSI